jgi:ubiquinone/menaquinone biosynthesis C-methylase UbiE
LVLTRECAVHVTSGSDERKMKKMMEKKQHWENVYQTKSDLEVSWYRDHLENSIKLILETGVDKDAAIIDVGGGSSTLVDDLLDHGFTDVTVLDISLTALERSRERLGERARKVEWIDADITEVEFRKPIRRLARQGGVSFPNR